LKTMRLVTVETHPIQYHAPIWRLLGERHGIRVTAVYGSDFSVAGYRDREFGSQFAWDTDLMSGYEPVFLSRSAEGGAKTAEAVRTRGLKRALRAAHADAVLLVGYSPLFYGAACAHALGLGIPVLFRGETTDHARSRGGLAAFVRDQALRRLYARCARVLYIGERSRRHFERLGCRAEKTVFSPYGVDTTPFRCDAGARRELRGATRGRLGIDPAERVLLFCGKLSPRKGVDRILPALAGLARSTGLRARALFLGSGELESALREQARATGVPATFTGFQNQSRLSGHYHASDALVLPSRHSETWGLVVNEALHHGIPCAVSAAVGCAPDLIEPGRTGEVFDDPEPSLVAALERVFAYAYTAADLCRQKVSAYSLDAAAAGIATACRGVVRGEAGSP